MQDSGNIHKSKKAKVGTGLSLEKFAKAKSSQYDKKRKAETQAKLAAKQVNKYRKLKARIQKSGVLQPVKGLGGGCAEGRQDAERDRIFARAGPAPDDSGEDAELTSADEEEQPQAYRAVEKSQDDDQVSGLLLGQEGAAPASLGPQLEGLEHAVGLGKKGKKRKARPPSQIQRIAKGVQAEKNAKQKAKEEAAAAAAERKAKQEEVEKLRKQQSKLFRKKTRRGQPVMKFRVEKILEQLQRQQ